MNFFQDYIMSAISCIIFGTICEFLIPSSSIKKYTKLIIGMILVLTLTNFLSHNLDLGFNINQLNEKVSSFASGNNSSGREEAVSNFQTNCLLENNRINNENSLNLEFIYKLKLQKKIKEAIDNKIAHDSEAFVTINAEKDCFPEISDIEIIVETNDLNKQKTENIEKSVMDILKNEFGIRNENVNIKIKDN